MTITLTVIPGTSFSLTSVLTAANLNLAANPTVNGSVTFADGYSDVIVSATTKTFTTFDLTNDILRVTDGHGASVGQRVKVSSATTLPGGLSASYEYFLRPDASNPTTDFTLHYSAAGAAAGTDRVDVTSAGTGAHTLTFYSYATGAPFIFDTSDNTWQKGIVSAENLPEYQGNSATNPGVRGALPGAAPGVGADYYFAPDAVWRQLPSPTDTGNNLYLNENVY